MQNYFFLILGMHRSGTSLLARCLNVSGVSLGENLLLSDGSASDNPKGFWENEEFTKLSIQLLIENNVKWDQIKSGLRCSDSLKLQYKTLINKLVSESYLAAGVKDPRLLFILDSILDVFPENKKYVGIFRHPLKVAESLKIRDNLDYEKSLELWQTSNLKLLEHIKNNNGFLIDFDWPKEKLLGDVSQLIKKVGLLETDLSLVYSEDLFRSDKSYNNSYKLPLEIEETYQKLKDRSMQNNTIKPEPISFSINESREIMIKMLGLINKLTSVKNADYKSISLNEKFLKNKRRIRRSLRKLSR